MELFKIISVLLFFTYYCKGHFILRNQNNLQSPSIPTLNFQTYSDYLKPLHRIRYLSPQRTIESRIDHRTPRPTQIPTSKKQTTTLNKGSNGMLSVIQNLVKLFIEKLGKSHRIVKKPKKDRGIYEQHSNFALYHKLIPKLIKEVPKHYGKIPRDKFINNTRQEKNKSEKSAIDILDLANNKEKSNHFKLNNSMMLEGTKNRAGYINKIKAKSIFGNFEDNEHFANIFIFHPNNDNSALVGLRDNLTDPSNINSSENSIKIPIYETTKRGLPFTVNDGNRLVGNKDEESFHDNMDTKTIPTVDIISTESMVPDGTVSTTEISVSFVNDEVENIKDDNITENSDDILPSIGYEEEEVVTAKVINSSKVKDVVSTEVTPEAETITTEDLSITSTSISTNTDLFSTTSAENTVVKELTESLSENDESILTSTVVNVITESAPENPNNALDRTKDEEYLEYQENSEIKDLMEEKNIDVTVGHSAVVTPLPVSTDENVTEEVNNLTDYVIEEADMLYDHSKEEIGDTITEMNVDSTVATVAKATTIEYINVTTTDVATTTIPYEETTEIDADSRSTIILDNTVEPTTIQTLSTEDGGIATQSFDHTKKHFNSLPDAINDDYIEIEYTYNIFLK